MVREFEYAALEQAFDLARKAALRGDVPVGAAVLSNGGKTLGLGANCREIPPFDPTGHAEIVALRAAAESLGTWNLSGCSLVVTLEPCTMCAGAIVASRIARLVFAVWDEKAGACGSIRDVVRDSRLNHQVQVYGGVAPELGSDLLTEFFKPRRDANLNRRDAFEVQD